MCNKCLAEWIKWLIFTCVSWIWFLVRSLWLLMRFREASGCNDAKFCLMSGRVVRRCCCWWMLLNLFGSLSMHKPILCLIHWLCTSCLIELWTYVKVTQFHLVFEELSLAFLLVCIIRFLFDVVLYGENLFLIVSSTGYKYWYIYPDAVLALSPHQININI